MNSNYYLKLLLGTIILVVLNSLGNLLFDSGIPFSATNILWGTVSNFLIVTLFGFYVSHSTLRGLRLTFSVLVIYFIIGYLNILIEAYIFNITDSAETFKEMLRGLFIVSIFCPLFIYIFNKWDGHIAPVKFEKRSLFGWCWRVFLGVVLYLIFYLTAGIILQATYPGLMDFYRNKLPPIDVMFLTQFPRGLLFVGIAILVLRTLKIRLIKKAALIGLVFSILGGIAPLLILNELMPNNIRLAHGFEIGISNFLYGLVLGFLLGQKTTIEMPATAKNI